MAVKPISAKEDLDQKFIPDEVIEAFNELIMENITLKGVAEFSQDDVIERIISKGLVLEKNRLDIIIQGWLNVGKIYAKYGWVVTYDKPDYNDPFSATFTFKSSKRGSRVVHHSEIEI